MIVPELSRSMLRNALVLGLFAIGTVGTVTLLQQGTATRIQAAERAAQVRALGEILPAGSYDNDLLADTVQVEDPLLGRRGSAPAYRALKAGEPQAVILQATAPDGYSGAIQLLVGVFADGRLAGVRVVQHRETPGLGDKIEPTKSDWILGFAGKSLAEPDDAGWAVKKDGGQFDAFAGATITPRAVVGAVHRALRYFAAHRETLLGLPAAGEAAGGPVPAPEGPATVHSRAGDAAARETPPIPDPQEQRP